MLRCKPGDLALTVSGAPPNVGLAVTCLELLPAGAANIDAQEGPIWHIDRPLEYRNELGGFFGNFAPDNALMPIRPDNRLAASHSETSCDGAR
ncbi:MAG: hypothetical protein ACRD3Q_02275 [Terriglobales bacterium]